MSRLRIATRRSPLALWQARHVAERLRAAEASLEIEFVELTTAGDRFLRAPLSQVGGKGLFVKEIEQALLEERAEIAVHSLKDLTSQMPDGLCLAAVPKREDPRDAWVSPRGLGLETVPKGARVGTSSLRRACQLLHRRPDLEVVPLRGNVQRRVDKAREQGLAGTLLAFAGLRRLGLEGQVTQVLSVEESLPAVGQGTLAIQCRADDARTRALLGGLEDGPTRIATDAERAFLETLEGGCTVPMAGHARVEGGSVWMRGLIGHPRGVKLVEGERRGSAAQARALGHALAEELLENGGAELIAAHAGKPALGAGDADPA